MSYTIDQTHFPSTQIHLNSKYADAYGGTPSAKSWCYFIFKEPVVKLPNAYDFLISLTSMECPCSSYCVTSSNNTMTCNVTYRDNSLQVITTITLLYTIPPGNYTSADIMTSSPVYDPLNYIKLSINSYNDLTNKFTFYVTNISGLSNIQILNCSVVYTNTPIFGFTSVVAGIRVGSSLVYSLTSNACVDLSGSRAIFFKVMNVHTQSYDSRTKYSGSILARIPMSQEQLGIVFWSNYGSFKSKCSLKNVSSLEIQIVDEDGNLVDFNNIDWTATITLDIIGKSPDFVADTPTFK